MRLTLERIALALLLALAPGLAFAQRLPFERAFDVGAGAVLDVSTLRGKIEVLAGDRRHVSVHGVVTVRVGVDVPAGALELAKKLAASPPVAREGNTVTLRPPTDAADRRAVTISYQVHVPPDTEVRTDSDSGATSVSGVSGRVTVRTQSAAISLASLSGAVDVTTGSGAVTADGSAGVLSVKTSSSGFKGTHLASLQLRTNSGAVTATFSGEGDATVETGSGSIKLNGLRGGVAVTTQSGRIQVEGTPARPWTARAGSSAIELSVASGTGFSVDASSHSGDVTVEGAAVEGATTKHKVTGSVRGGGPLMQATSQSGAIRIRVAH
jgi:hypothetical protein